MSSSKNEMRSKLIARNQKFKREFPFSKKEGITKKEIEDTKVNEQLKKGLLFEQYIVQLFDPEFFTLVEWRSDKIIDGRAPISNQFPDLEFFLETKSQQLHFAVECKWRKEIKYETVEIARESQLENYRLFEEIGKTLVYIALGIGGEPNKPNALYIIPLKDIEESLMDTFRLEIYRRRDASKMFFLDGRSRKLL